MQTDGQPDMTKLIMAFCNPAKASKKKWNDFEATANLTKILS